ncbi:argininosuccinate lyase [Gammaproteobacteria bacterium]|jgi:argininosuccinate lyase|nr:argininosuccinate lyase [Gammaproteobacteria bacterium]MDB2704638.1 argininosuccinate lyase [Gammaproteobacteria bacterium]MDC0348090.1 argininosuccinate lyase [Gammaproteobacteria bacterium]MDC1073814.1 argininosuccinate lyase [Gammaproteobacteria bacterium]
MSKKIWNTKGIESSYEITSFLAGEDIELDKSIFIYDIDATIAHIKGLASIGVIKKNELAKLIKSLKELRLKFLNKSFKLTEKYEDCHSAIEFYLTKELGELGKKVHTGRSRNDQVLVAMRLFAKKNLIDFKKSNKSIARVLLRMAKKHENNPMPGYTHLQRAMPSSWGLWFASYAESFIDNVDLINSTIEWIDSNPLGSAAGYGVALPLDRKLTTKELGFKRTQINSLYIQNSRGKYEMQIINTLKQSMLDVRKFSWDMSLFLSQEFDLLKIDKAYLTGSSIMPNKHNPDVIEILRANYSILAGQASELENLLSLPSGYQRDLQLTKRSLISSFDISLKSLNILPKLIDSIKVNKSKSIAYIDEEMKMTDKVYALVAQGKPFRDAYNLIKNSDDLSSYAQSNSKDYSEGSPGNLALDKLDARLKKQK